MAKRHIIPIFVPHLGCPYRCVFCDQKSISGETEPPSGEKTTALIEKGLDFAGGIPEVAFYGGSFTAVARQIQEELLRAAMPYAESGRISGIRLSTRPDHIDEETLDFLREWGVQTIELGAQSMCDNVLAASGRGHTAEAVRRASRLIREAGFSLILQVMCGLPGETEEDARETARQASELRPDGVRIYPAAVIKGTRLADMAADGSYTPLSLEEAVERAADMAEIFSAAGIPILRIGLQPSEALEATVAAGAYHPALGEMVRSRLWLRRMMQAIDGLASPKGAVCFFVPPKELSAAIGQRNENLHRLKAAYPEINLKIKGNGEAPETGYLEKTENPFPGK